MPNVDEQGNKIAAKKESKSVLSLRKRERRISIVQQANKAVDENRKPDVKSNPAFCGKCGFRVRNKNHENGKHHQLAK